METDFFAVQQLEKQLDKKSFFEIQRLSYPLLKEDNINDNSFSYTLLCNYYNRLNSKDDSSAEKIIADFIDSHNTKIVDDKNINKLIKSLSYDDLIYLNDLIEVTLYQGKTITISKDRKIDYLGTMIKTQFLTEDGKPYVHYDYDKIMKNLLKMISLEINLRYSKIVLEKYGIDNFDDLTYDDFNDIMTYMAIEGSNNKYSTNDYKNTEYVRLFYSISHIVGNYYEYSLNLDLSKVNFKKLSSDKLLELYNVLDLSLKLLKYGNKDLNYSAFAVVRNSDFVIDIQNLDDAIDICENNSIDVIREAFDKLIKEISYRKNRLDNRSKIKKSTKAMHKNMIKEISNNKVLKK